jgi:hypothetical protein
MTEALADLSQEAKTLAHIYRVDPDLVETIRESVAPRLRRRCPCGCEQVAPKGRVYVPGHAVRHHRSLAQQTNGRSYLTPPKTKRRLRRKAHPHTIRPAAELGDPRPAESSIVAKWSDAKLRERLMVEGPLSLHERSGVRQRSMAAAIVNELDRRGMVTMSTKAVRALQLERRLRQSLKAAERDAARRERQATKITTQSKETGKDMTTTKTTKSSARKAPAKAAAKAAATKATRKGATTQSKETAKMTTTNGTKATPAKRGGSRAPAPRPGTPTPEQRDAAVAERKRAKADQEQAAKDAKAKARVERYEAAKAAAKNGKDPAEVLARPLPKTEPAERQGRANAAVPADLAAHRGNYSAPKDMTRAQADKAAQGLDDATLAAKLRLMDLKKGGFRDVEKGAFLAEAARRLVGGKIPATAKVPAAKTPAAKVPAAKAPAKKAPASKAPASASRARQTAAGKKQQANVAAQKQAGRGSLRGKGVRQTASTRKAA